MNDERRDELILQISQDIAEIKVKVNADYRILHGNGHPGLIDRMNAAEHKLLMLASRGAWWKELGGWLMAGILAIVNIYIQLKK